MTDEILNFLYDTIWNEYYDVTYSRYYYTADICKGFPVLKVQRWENEGTFDSVCDSAWVYVRGGVLVVEIGGQEVYQTSIWNCPIPSNSENKVGDSYVPQDGFGDFRAPRNWLADKIVSFLARD